MIETKELIDVIPLPFFRVTRTGDILEASDATFKLFPKSSQFLDLVDIGSRKKAREFLLNNDEFPIRVELNMMVIGHSMQLFEVMADFDALEDTLHLICLTKTQDPNSSVEQKLREAENRSRELSRLLHTRDTELKDTLNAMKELSVKYDNLTTVKRLAASLAHEVRNPLTTVRGFLQLISPYLKDSGKVSYAEVAIDEIDRANQIIYEFLNASKTPPVKKEISDINTVIEDIVLLCQSEAILSNIVLTYEPAQDKINVMIDAKQIKQVLLNLIQNALQAIEEAEITDRGAVNLSSTILGDEVLISIQDNGSGIEEPVLDSLFKPFFTTKKEGNGIGLAVCADIIRDHNGRIQVESHPGLGSTFTISLPLQK